MQKNMFYDVISDLNRHFSLFKHAEHNLEIVIFNDNYKFAGKNCPKNSRSPFDSRLLR